MFATSKSADAVYLAGGDGVADAIDFDGTNDYLSRASDLVGNVDGKTFTFSCWVYRAAAATQYIYIDQTNSVSRSMRVFLNASGTLTVEAANTATSSVLNISTIEVVPLNTMSHILVSLDLSSTSNRSVWINDVQATVAWTTYVNDNIDFTRSNHYIGAIQTPAAGLTGRISHLFLDYTYRDLGVEANRRLFITADRKPALNQQALNPILYLPLSDQTQPGLNLGTGGNFALTGVVARSGRGPSQFNAPYSDFDGAADYLSRTTALSGITDGKQFTFSCNFSSDDAVTLLNQVAFNTGSSYRFEVRTTEIAGEKVIEVRAANSAGTEVLRVQTSGFTASRNYIVSISVDLTDTGKRFFYVNGVAASATWATYSNSNIQFLITSTPRYFVGANGSSGTGAGFFNGRLGNVFFDTKYIDLSQPANLAKFVTGTGIDAKPVDLGANGEKPFGTPPLIYLPMYGNNAGKNYGSGGDFSVQSGPFAGARGPNEFFGNKADFDGSTGYLSRTSALTGVSDGKVASVSFKFRADTVVDNTYSIFSINTLGFTIALDTTSNDRIRVYASNGMDFYVYPAAYFLVNTDYFIQLCIDRADYSKTLCYIDGVAATKSGSHTDTNTLYSSASVAIGSRSDSTYKFDGKLSEFYFATEYIDFSQEVNRLKFRDAFGNTVDLAPQIKAGTLPNPAIYMRFDPANQGKNYGTGGDFTKTGTINDGGQL